MKCINLILAFMMLLTASAYAVTDLGVHGKTYQIEENDFYDWLMSEISKKQHLVKGFGKDELSKKLGQAMKLEGLNVSDCTENSTRLVDPTYVLERNITDASQNILYSKGTTVNPLDYFNLQRNYMFLDVDNNEHLKVYFSKVKANPKHPIQPIAVNGDLQLFFDLSQKNGVNVPAGKANEGMLKKFNLSCAPSLISQEGKMVRVQSFRTEKVKK